MKRTKKKLTIGPNDAIASFGLETGVAGVGAFLQGGRWKVCGGAGAGAGGRWWLRWEEGREVAASSTTMAAEWCGGECDELACLLTAA